MTDTRDRLAEALARGWIKGAPFVVNEAEGACTRMDFERYADDLLPVVAELVREGQAEALEVAAEWSSSVPRHMLRARAAALRAGGTA